MGEMVVGSPYSASNVHEAANDNTNPYRNMVMDAIRMNQGNVSQCPIIEEEPNADRLFMSLRIAERMTWHQAHDAVDGVMVHPFDGEACKLFNSVYPYFLAESRNVHLRLCIDGFNPFG
ncbi:hypothetical protein D5086_026927 [Populus alba]|uniref:Uncharacterized protein n=1 Tax=Populus alba TaxID=43335 RepID=A0ACC4B382_POPAL